MLYIQVKQTSDGMINYLVMAVCWDNGFSALMNLTKDKHVGSYFGVIHLCSVKLVHHYS